MEITNYNQGKRKNNKWKYIAVFTLLIIMAGCVLINAYLLYSKVFQQISLRLLMIIGLLFSEMTARIRKKLFLLLAVLTMNYPTFLLSSWESALSAIHRGIKCTVWHWILIPSPNGIPKSFKHKNHTPYCLRFTL